MTPEDKELERMWKKSAVVYIDARAQYVLMY
jgi:hypothetical protein